MILEILKEIAEENSTNSKMDILKKYKDNVILSKVLYSALSKRVKFHIKQIPSYTPISETLSLEEALVSLSDLSDRVKTGNEGINHLKTILESLSEDNAYIIERIIEKDLKIGMGRSNVNKVIPKLIEKTFYMGAKAFDEKYAKAIFKDGKKGLSELKADGRYCNAVIRSNEFELESRQGEKTHINPCKLTRELAMFDDCVLNGEILIGNIKRETANGLMTSIINITEKLNSDDPKEVTKGEKSIENMRKKHGYDYYELLDDIKFVVWDILDIDDFFTNNSTTPRIDRLKRLEEEVAKHNCERISVIEYKIVDSYEDAIQHFVDMLERGEEGTVLKSLDGVWKDGKRWNQIKMKVEYDLDLVAKSFNYGNKGTKNENVISSITCESSDGLLVAKAQGLTEEMMDYVTENKDKLEDTIMEVTCNGLSNNRKGGNSVLYPRLKAIRDDKSEANSFEECQEIDRAAKGLEKIINE